PNVGEIQAALAREKFWNPEHKEVPERIRQKAAEEHGPGLAVAQQVPPWNLAAGGSLLSIRHFHLRMGPPEKLERDNPDESQRARGHKRRAPTPAQRDGGDQRRRDHCP